MRSWPGCPMCPASPGQGTPLPSTPAVTCWSSAATGSDVLRFTRDTRVWPTNNISERGVRPLKTQQKISGRLTSTEVTQDRLDIRSYIDTARKHGQDVLTVLRSVMTGAPWHPPIPAPAPP